MRQIKPNIQNPLPRHYYQVALDFKRLATRIALACQKKQPTVTFMVADPATILRDWDTSFQRYIRPLARIFHAISSQVLTRQNGLTLHDTVQSLVPLEQQVYRLLTLREMVQKHRFPQGWQRGQAFFLARIDKILADMQGILRYFNILVLRSQQDPQPTGTYTWDSEIECRLQSETFYNWCQEMNCPVPLHYFCKMLARRAVEQIRGRYFEPVLRACPVSSFTVR